MTLAARNAREQWETIFNKHYIQPVLGSLEQKVGLAIHMILGDDDQGWCNLVLPMHHQESIAIWYYLSILEHDQLFYLVYERMELMNESSIQPHLWTYRSRITLEHLAQTLQEKKMKKDYPILHEFLQAVSCQLHPRVNESSIVYWLIIGASIASYSIPAWHSEATTVSLWCLPSSPGQKGCCYTDN